MRNFRQPPQTADLRPAAELAGIMIPVTSITGNEAGATSIAGMPALIATDGAPLFAHPTGDLRMNPVPAGRR